MVTSCREELNFLFCKIASVSQLSLHKLSSPKLYVTPVCSNLIYAVLGYSSKENEKWRPFGVLTLPLAVQVAIFVPPSAIYVPRQWWESYRNPWLRRELSFGAPYHSAKDAEITVSLWAGVCYPESPLLSRTSEKVGVQPSRNAKEEKLFVLVRVFCSTFRANVEASFWEHGLLVAPGKNSWLSLTVLFHLWSSAHPNHTHMGGFLDSVVDRCTPDSGEQVWCQQRQEVGNLVSTHRDFA